MEREITVARKRVKDADTVSKQQHKQIRNAEHTGVTTREAAKMFQEMKIAIGDSLSNLANSNQEEDGDDEYHLDTDRGKRSEDDEPG